MTANGLLSSIVHAYERLKPLVWLTLFGLVALGFEFRPPSTIFRELRQADSVLATRIVDHELTAAREHRSMNGDYEQTSELVLALARGACLDRPARETRLMGLPCEELLRGRKRP